MTGARVTYRQRPDATAEGELNALAAVYKLVLDCHAKKQAVEPASKPNGRDVVKESNEHDATGSIPRGS